MKKIFHHQLVPEHRKLSEDEAGEILKKYSINRKQLPRIFSKDAALKDIEATNGDIIEMKRESIVGGENLYYRVVVEE